MARANDNSIARDTRLLLAALIALDTLASGTSTRWIAYQAGQALLELCAEPDGEARTFYAFPKQGDRLDAISALVNALGNGENEELNRQVLAGIEKLQGAMYGDMERYLTDCDNSGKHK